MRESIHRSRLKSVMALLRRPKRSRFGHPILHLLLVAGMAALVFRRVWTFTAPALDASRVPLLNVVRSAGRNADMRSRHWLMARGRGATAGADKDSTAVTSNRYSSMWIDPWRRSTHRALPVERLTKREWQRMYRTLGLDADSTSREQAIQAASRLRRKYSDNQAALERVEVANLWIMTRIVSEQEAALKRVQHTNRLREFSVTSQRYFADYVPKVVRQMVGIPTARELQRASGLFGVFALMGVCVPTLALNSVGLGAVSALGLIYQRGRPEPAKDEMGNVGEVQSINIKEMCASAAVVMLAGLLGALTAFALGVVGMAPLPMAFSTTCCFAFWLAALFFKAYQCFGS